MEVAMSKQVLVVSSQQRSVRGRVALMILVAALAIWFFQSPAEAANGIKAGWNALAYAADAVATFITSVAG
jgi:hypothetical protein